MEGTLNKIRNNIHYIVYAAFLVLQAVSHRYLVLFGDDFYYANFIPQGWDYFVKENIFHYTDTNGRFFVHLLDELLLGFDMIFWKIFNLAVIALIVLFAAKNVPARRRTPPEASTRLTKNRGRRCFLPRPVSAKTVRMRKTNVRRMAKNRYITVPGLYSTMISSSARLGTKWRSALSRK